MPRSIPAEAQAVLDFWFLPEADPGHGASRKEWFIKEPEFDDAIRSRFGALVETALEGGLQDWTSTRMGTLALIIVLDQFPRNLYRGMAQAFAGDARALGLARALVDAGLDADLPPVMRCFLYLPYEHCEDADTVRQIGPKFESLSAFEETKDTHIYWAKHLDVLERFGRYPHRNAALNRPSTPEEEVWNNTPGTGF